MCSADRDVRQDDHDTDDQHDPSQFEGELEVLRGAVDLHVHPGPSPFPRRIGIAEAARQAADAGFRAIVVKSHHHSMVTDIQAIEGAATQPGASSRLPIPVFGGTTLNNHLGGINPHQVDLALNMGGRVVWFPTISSPQHLAEHGELKFPSATKPLLTPTPVEVVDGEGQLLPEVIDVLEIIRDHDGVLAAGHLAPDDIDVLVGQASRMGLRRILIQHPNFVVGATPERSAHWADAGAVIEHCLCMYDDRATFYHWEIDVLLDYLKAVGPERTALVSDLGQKNNPLPVNAYARIVRLLIEAGVEQDALRSILRDAPSRVLDL